MATDTVTIDQFIADAKITMTAKRTDNNPLMDHDPKYPMDHWKVTMVRNTEGRKPRMTVAFSMGIKHHGAEPEISDVLDCLAYDSSSIENNQTFSDWCGEYGYDTDSRKAERTWKACKHSATRLRNFLGENLYQTLLWNTERA